MQIKTNNFLPPVSASGLVHLGWVVASPEAPPPRYHGSCAVSEHGGPGRGQRESGASCPQHHHNTDQRGSASCRSQIGAHLRLGEGLIRGVFSAIYGLNCFFCNLYFSYTLFFFFTYKRFSAIDIFAI